MRELFLVRNGIGLIQEFFFKPSAPLKKIYLVYYLIAPTQSIKKQEGAVKQILCSVNVAPSSITSLQARTQRDTKWTGYLLTFTLLCVSVSIVFNCTV